MSDDAEKVEENTASEAIALSCTPALTALVKPTFEMLGNEVRDSIKESIDNWRDKRRRKNLEAHLEAVNAELNTKDSTNHEPPSLAQVDTAEEWLTSVQDVDPQDEELSAIWQGLLIRAVNGDSIADEVRQTLKLLTPEQAKLLFEFKRRIPAFPLHAGTVGAKERYLAKKLEVNKVLEKDYTYTIIFTSTILLSTGFFIYFFGNVFYSSIQPVLLWGAALLFTLTSTALAFRLGISRWRLSWLGRELMRLVSDRN
ncbi:hypothetical protein [Idiomarina aquatica]|uniref:Uncharacterized protein n=1 Tax=Idiomarina aquatica TaxID=1327752 RepID=A0AA94JDB1_9GAMM|nr:hypothetical protein [Idiomarina aquatica]RUO44539.1 hypothetical protein CWE23_00385 [Idiomarina aquatica]